VLYRIAAAFAVIIVLAGGVAFDHDASARSRRARVSALAQGSWTRGAQLYAEKGCGACHKLQGLPLPQGGVGPDLTDIASRGYIAGRLRNSPENLADWLRRPREIDPQTAMPDVGLTSADARSLTAFLYAPG
jgi:cytochrome c